MSTAAPLMARRWSANEDAALTRAYQAGAAVREIARELRRSEDAVNARRRALGLTARRAARRWSRGADALLAAATREGLPAALIAERLGRPLSQVRWRRRVLGVTRPPSRRYSVEEDALMRAALSRGGDLQQLARRLGRSPDALRLRAAKLGVHQPSPRRRWMSAEDAAVRDGYDTGLTCAEIAGELGGRTAAGVAARARHLGLATHARRWSAADDERLRRLAAERSVQVLARLLGRTPDALRQRARKLGVLVHDEAHGGRAGERWTPDEEDMLRLHPGLNPAALAEMLGRSDRAITIRLAKLGLRDGRHRSPHRRTSAPGRLTAGERALVEREARLGDARRMHTVVQRLGLPYDLLSDVLARARADGTEPHAAIDRRAGTS